MFISILIDIQQIHIFHSRSKNRPKFDRKNIHYFLLLSLMIWNSLWRRCFFAYWFNLLCLCARLLLGFHGWVTRDSRAWSCRKLRRFLNWLRLQQIIHSLITSRNCLIWIWTFITIIKIVSFLLFFIFSYRFFVLLYNLLLFAIILFIFNLFSSDFLLSFFLWQLFADLFFLGLLDLRFFNFFALLFLNEFHNCFIIIIFEVTLIDISFILITFQQQIIACGNVVVFIGV